MAMKIVKNKPGHRFETVSGDSMAFLEYALSGTVMTLMHTEVPESLQGQGLGGQLVRFALEHARQNNLSIVARCPFAQSYLKRHAEYADLVKRS